MARKKKPSPGDTQLATAIENGNGHNDERPELLPRIELVRADKMVSLLNWQAISVIASFLAVLVAGVVGYTTHANKLLQVEQTVSGADGEGGLKAKVEVASEKINEIHTEQRVMSTEQTAMKDDVAETKKAVEQVRRLLETRLP